MNLNIRIIHDKLMSISIHSGKGINSVVRSGVNSELSRYLAETSPKLLHLVLFFYFLKSCGLQVSGSVFLVLDVALTSFSLAQVSESLNWVEK